MIIKDVYDIDFSFNSLEKYNMNFLGIYDNQFF